MQQCYEKVCLNLLTVVIYCGLMGLTVRKRSPRAFGPIFSIQKRRGGIFYRPCVIALPPPDAILCFSQKYNPFLKISQI